MAKKAISGGRGVLGIQFSGKTQARVPSATRSGGAMGANQTVQKGVRYTNQPMVDKGRVVKTMNPMRSRQQATSLVGGLGMQPYMNPKPSMQMRTGLTTTTAERTKMYGGTPSKAKTQVQTKAKAPARKATTINIPGGGLRTAKPASAKTTRPLTASEARSQAPGNYRTGKVTMGGKTYTGYTVSSRTDSKGRTTKSVGNWTSTPNAGRSTNRFGGKSDVAGPRRDSSGRNVSSAAGKRK